MAGIIIDGVVKIKFAAPTNIISNQPAFAQDTFNLKRVSNKQNVQRWEITTNLMPENNSGEYLAHSVAMGFTEVFSIQVPQVYRSSDSTTAKNVKVLANALPNSESISISLTGVIKRGEFIRFENHDKVYMVVSDSKDGLIKISPRLTSNVPQNTNVLVGSQVFMKVRYDLTTRLGIQYIDGILSDPGAVTFVEAL